MAEHILSLSYGRDSLACLGAIEQHGHTAHDFDQRFRLEDEGFLAANDKNFRWDSLNEELNYRLF